MYSKDSKEIRQIAMTKLYHKEVKAWLIAGGDTEESLEEAVCINDLIANYDTDAYQFAKWLDDKSWCPDAELVEILDNASHYVNIAWTEYVAKWLSENKAFVPYNVGDRCLVTKTYSFLKDKEVIITTVRLESLDYTVQKIAEYVPGYQGGYVLEHNDLQKL